MKKMVVAFLIGLFCTLPALAQNITCGPFQPFARVINADGTETVYTYAVCQNPDPADWSHTYTFQFPSTLTYWNGTTLSFTGNASAQVFGHDDCVSSGRAGGRCGRRLVTINSASLTDPTGASVPIVKVELGSGAYPIDAWESTTPLAPDTVYSFEVAGTSNVPYSPGITDTLHIQAAYQLVAAPPPAPCTDCGSD